MFAMMDDGLVAISPRSLPISVRDSDKSLSPLRRSVSLNPTVPAVIEVLDMVALSGMPGLERGGMADGPCVASRPGKLLDVSCVWSRADGWVGLMSGVTSASIAGPMASPSFPPSFLSDAD